MRWWQSCSKFFVPCDLEIDEWPWKTIGLYYIKFCASFQSLRCIQTLVTVRKHSICVKICDFSRVTMKFGRWPWETIGRPSYAFLCFVHQFIATNEFKLELQPETDNLFQNRWFISRVTLKFDRRPWETIGHIFCESSSFVHHITAIVEFKLELDSGNSQFGSKSTFFFLAAWPWNLKDDLKRHKRPCLINNIKLCASFHHHMWILAGVTDRKRLNWVLAYMTMTFYLWPWPFARTSLLSLVINSENFMMIRWWEHCQKDVTGGQTDRQSDRRAELFI